MAKLLNPRPATPRPLSAVRAARKTGPKARRKRTRDELVRAIVDAFRREFPTDTIDVSDGYKDNIHVLVVSRKFDSMSERRKQDMMSTLLKSADVTQEEMELITVLMALSPGEIK
jgi:hypothetical protein